jgi:hypothetical protein
VEFDYSVVRAPNRLWKKLPQWVTSQLPFGRTNRIATTEVINVPPKIREQAASLRAAADADLRKERERITRERERARRQAWRPPLLPLPDSDEPFDNSRDAGVFGSIENESLPRR